MENKEWYTQQEIADDLNLPLERVRNTVAALDNLGSIRTTRDPRDRRYLLIHTSSLITLRKALLGEAGS